MDYKKMQADKTTVTHDVNKIDAATNNIYEALTIIAKRAEQINDDTREELHAKLQEFASSTESLEEIFENKEQIEVRTSEHHFTGHRICSTIDRHGESSRWH